jgi:hypothetical protein
MKIMSDCNRDDVMNELAYLKAHSKASRGGNLKVFETS